VRVDTGKNEAMTPEDKAEALQSIGRAPPVVRPFLRRAIEDPAGLKRRVLDALPRVFFVLLPVFAAIVAVFYRGRRFPEHLYFAIHLHAFVFLVLAAAEALNFTRVPALAEAAGLAAIVWIPVYATKSLRRVYGGSLPITLAKEVGIGAIYALASLLAFILALYWASVSP
jgi:hypothetical protein